MAKPTFTREGYPTRTTINKISSWPSKDLLGLIEFVKECWSDYGSIREEDGLLKLATGGWSGNEEILYSLEKNHLFWSLCWESSHRGGLVCFNLKKLKDWKANAKN